MSTIDNRGLQIPPQPTVEDIVKWLILNCNKEHYKSPSPSVNEGNELGKPSVVQNHNTPVHVITFSVWATDLFTYQRTHSKQSTGAVLDLVARG